MVYYLRLLRRTWSSQDVSKQKVLCEMEIRNECAGGRSQRPRGEWYYGEANEDWSVVSTMKDNRTVPHLKRESMLTLVLTGFMIQGACVQLVSSERVSGKY
jgi:hypothetical protein